MAVVAEPVRKTICMVLRICVLVGVWGAFEPARAVSDQLAPDGQEQPATSSDSSAGTGKGSDKQGRGGDIEKNTRLSMKRNGASRRLYPWGNDPDPNRANYDETGIGATSAVGCFPGGASPYGCEEMSGNVWEWTRSLCNEYPYDPKDGRENLEALKNYARVVRGGLFNHYLRYARCPCRFWFNPGFWDDLRGFRVMLSPFISEL